MSSQDGKDIPTHCCISKNNNDMFHIAIIDEI